MTYVCEESPTQEFCNPHKSYKIFAFQTDLIYHLLHLVKSYRFVRTTCHSYIVHGLSTLAHFIVIMEFMESQHHLQSQRIQAGPDPAFWKSSDGRKTTKTALRAGANLAFWQSSGGQKTTRPILQGRTQNSRKALGDKKLRGMPSKQGWIQHFDKLWRTPELPPTENTPHPLLSSLVSLGIIEDSLRRGYPCRSGEPTDLEIVGH